MLLTEAEAKTKWCPFARVHTEEGSFNRVDAAVRPDCSCIASVCMAWRYIGAEEFRKSDGTQILLGETYSLNDVEYRPSDKGYCGVAIGGGR